MNDLQNSILESISILAKSASQSTPATLTVEAVILNTVDAGSGTYLVEYLGNKFKAYADVASKYSAGELVYVIIPNGDFTKNKIILRAVTPTAKNYIEDSSEKIYYNNVTGNLLDYENTIELSSYKNEVVDLSTDTSAAVALEGLKKSLNRYFSTGVKTFKLGMSVKTNILGQSYGNYGLILDIPTADNGVRRFVLDTSDISGNPYALNTWTPQSKVFTLESFDNSRNIKLYAFVEGFIEDEEKAKEVFDIFFQGFNLYGVELTAGSTEITNYKLSLSATDGSLFLSESDKTIFPKLFIDDKETTLEGFDCYWFEEDALVTASSNHYLTEGGIGWRCINKKTSIVTDALGLQNIQYNLNEYFYTILYSSFESIFSRRYKCVIDYNGILISKVIEIKNYVAPPFNMDLYSSTGNTSFIKGSNINLTCELKNFDTTIFTEDDLVYIWYRYDSEGNFIEKDFVNYIQQEKYMTEVSFSSNIIDTLNTIRCFIYTLDNETKNLKLLASDSVNVTIANNNEYFAVVFPNNLLYKYDSDGDSPMIADYDGPSPVAAIEPLQVHIYKKDGTELTESEYGLAKISWHVDRNSLLKVADELTPEDTEAEILIYSNVATLPYTIADSFNKEKSEKKISVNIEIDGTILTLEPNIQFFKEGESGLNGSKYTALIYYNGVPYDPFATERGHNLIAIEHNHGAHTWYTFNRENEVIEFNNSSPLVVKVFQDNKVLSQGYSIEWSVFDYNTNNIFSIDQNGKVTIQSKGANDIKYAVIQARIIIDNTSITETQEVIYCYYPIDVISYTANVNLNPSYILLPLMSGGFNFVTYTKDGINPKYDTTKDFKLSCLYENSDERGRFSNYNWSTSNSLVLPLDKDSKSITQTITPINRYDQTVSDLAISVTVKVNDFEGAVIAAPDEEEKNAAIQQYENNKIYLVNLLNYVDDFYKNNWLKNIAYCTDLLAYREAILLELDKINLILDNILAIRDTHKKAKEFKTIIANMKEQVYNFKETNYSNYKLDLEYPKDYEGDTPVTRILGQDFDQEIKFYNSACDDLIKYASTEEYKNAIKKYNEIKDVDLNKIPNIDRVNAVSQFFLVEEKINEIIYGIQYQTTATALNDYFSNIVIILNNYGVYNTVTEKWELNTKVNTWFQTEINSVQQKYDETLTQHLCERRHQISSGKTITITRPIIFFYNRDGLSTVQGWDGNKLYVTSSNNNEYLTSLHAAVGTYSQTQTYGLRANSAGFSGVALGTHVKIEENNESRDQGIYGYHNGKQTFMLNATNGIASFGVEGQGQIILDPSTEQAIIKSGNYNLEAGTGMQINLTEPNIQYGSGKFIVDSEGKLTAQDAVIKGKIEADEGYFKGQIIAGEGSSFAGEITAGSGTFTGTITATAGQFGNLLIQEGKIVIVTEFDEDGNPIASKDFIDSEGNTTVDFAEQGKVLTALTSSIGGWTVVGTDSAQMLQGVGKLLLDPQNNRLNYNDVTISTTTATDIQSGFYLGKEGLNIPNVIQITPNANDGQRWVLNSQNLEWYDSNTATGARTLKIGANGINLLNKILITNDSMNLNSNQITLGNDAGTIFNSNSKVTLNADSLETTFTNGIKITGKNFILTSDNFNIANDNFNVKVNGNSLLEGSVTDGTTSLVAKADILTLGKNQDIIVSADTVTFKDNETVKMGKTATFTNSASKLHSNDEITKVEVDADNVTVSARTKILLGDEIQITNNNVVINAKNISLSNHFVATEDVIKIASNEVEIDCMKITPSAAEVTGNLKVVQTAEIGGTVTVTGKATLNGPVEAPQGIISSSLTIGSVATFTEQDFEKLRNLLDSIN